MGAVLVAALGAVVIAGCEAPLGLGDDYSKATCEDIGDSDFRDEMATDIADRVLPDSPEPLDERASRVNGRLELACSEAPGDERPFEAVVAQSIEGPREPTRATGSPARKRRPARKPAAAQRVALDGRTP